MSQKGSSHRPNRKISKSLSGTGVTWHVTDCSDYQTGLYPIYRSDPELAAVERKQIAETVRFLVLWSFTNGEVTGKWGKGWTKFVEPRQMKRESIWDQSGRRSGSWPRAKCCGSAALTPSVCRMQGASTSLRSDTALKQPYVFWSESAIINPIDPRINKMFW